jgi:type I restriction enzyme M protein
LAYLLFLKMAEEQKLAFPQRPVLIPSGLDWESLRGLDGDALETHYRHILTSLGKKGGQMGLIFRKSQNKIQDPAKLKRLINLNDQEMRSALDADEIVDAAARLCAMNPYLHGIGAHLEVTDSLARDPGTRFDMVLTQFLNGQPISQ